MAAGFNRSPSPRSRAPTASGHVRSTSLPGPSHPVFSNLHSTIHSLHTCEHPPCTCASWLTTKLTHLELLLADLDDILHLPQAQLRLRRCRSSAWAETLLDHFLLLADTYGRFREAMASLHQLASEAQVALRRKDKQGLAVAAKAGKKVDKDVRKLLSSLREVGKGQDSIPTVAGGVDDQIVGALREARMAFCSVSAAVFMGAVDLSSSAFRVSTTMASHSSWSAIRKAVAVPAVATGESLKEVEECMVRMGIGSEKVLRRLLNTRVLLLNKLEPL